MEDASAPALIEANPNRGGRAFVGRERASKYGLNIADIEDVVETALGGHAATEIWEGEKKFGVVVRLRDADRNNVEDLRGLLIEAPDHSRVPLDQVARIGFHEGVLNISRENGRNTAAIGVFIKGRDMGSLVEEMQSVVNAKLKLPPGYSITWGGPVDDHSLQHCAHLRALVRSLQDRQERLSHPAQCAVRSRGRNPRALSHRHAPQRVGGHRIHCLVRTGGAQRRRHGEPLRRIARSRARRPRCGL